LPSIYPRTTIGVTVTVTSLFYIRLIGFTAGTLVYLFLLALILGHRRPRFFERLLFFLVLSLFLIYSGGLLQINAQIGYDTPPSLALLFADALIALGGLFLLPLTWHTHVKYLEQVRDETIRPSWRTLTWLLYLLPVPAAVALISGFYPSPVLNHRPWITLGGVNFVWFVVDVLLCSASAAALELRALRAAANTVERGLFLRLAGTSTLLAVMLIALCLSWERPTAMAEVLMTFALVIGIVPGAFLLFYALRRNFLEYGAQRNLMYALPVTFLALLYLALVRRVSGWLELILPPEATAAVLLFALIFLFEPLERVIGPVLQRRFLEGMGGVQRLTVELQQEARHGNVAQLVAEAESRIRQEYGLAEVRLSIPRDAAEKPLEAPGGLGHTTAMPLMKDGQEVGLLEASSTGAYLTGETTAALGFLAEQLPGMVDLARLIEDKLRLERQLAERERMASLGQMAANVSHNLRNPLSSMKTVLQVQLEDPDLPVNVRRDSTLVVGEIDRMSTKLTQLLRYAKPSVGGQRVAAVALANQTAILFRHDADTRNVRFEFERPTHEIYALASEEALNEILSNLIVNAIEAQTAGGRVRLSLSSYEGRLEIVVEDGGPGISPELRAKIFQPYFTTKPAGTGLGLSIVARRVEEIGGTISCESPVRNGKGTRFRLMLPIAEGDGEGTTK
jgi:signal transduction histidine kinase